jgi:hypothetical protein
MWRARFVLIYTSKCFPLIGRKPFVPIDTVMPPVCALIILFGHFMCIAVHWQIIHARRKSFQLSELISILELLQGIYHFSQFQIGRALIKYSLNTL